MAVGGIAVRWVLSSMNQTLSPWYVAVKRLGFMGDLAGVVVCWGGVVD